MNSKRQVSLWGLTAALITMAGLAFFAVRSSSFTFDDEAWESQTRSALISMKQGALPEAMQSCLEAMKLISSHRVRDMRLVKTYMLLAEIYRWQKEYDQAEEVFNLAVNSCEQFYGPMDPGLVVPLEALANFHYYSKVDYAQVASLYCRILEIIKHNNPDNHNDIAIQASNVAQVYLLMREWEKAETYHLLALEHARQNAKENAALGQRDLSQYLLTSADFYNEWGKCKKAVALSEEALDLRNELARSDSLIYANQDIQLDVVVALEVLGQVYVTCGKFVKAEDVYRKSIAIMEGIVGVGHPDLLMKLDGLASVFRAQKKYDEAEDCYQRILQIIEKNGLQEYPEARPLLESYEEFTRSKRPG